MSRTGPRPDARASSPRLLRVVIVDDHPIVRMGLTALIDNEPGMTVCGASDSVAGGLARIRQEQPDIAIVDLTLGLDNGLEIVKALDASASSVRVLVLSMHDELLHAERALRAGARGYVMKDQAARHLLDAIRAVASGKTYVSQEVSDRIVARLGTRSSGVPTADRLTDREREVFTLVGRGMNTRAIAQHLGLSVKTVETHHARIKDKLGLKSGHELLRAAIEWIRT